MAKIITLRVFGIVGLILFGTGFYFTYEVPGWVEEVGKTFIKQKLEEKTHAKIDELTESKSTQIIEKIGSALLQKTQTDIQKLKDGLKDHVDEKIAAVIAEMKNLDCECRKAYENAIKKSMQFTLVSLEIAQQKLTDFMKMKYMDIANKLSSDLRIFTGINSIVFLVLLLVSFLKPRAINHLFLPGVVLLISTIICSYFYIFEQNWFFTIIYNDYMGYGYLVYMAIIFTFLCDIVFNSARVSTSIINGFMDAIGSSIVVSPC